MVSLCFRLLAREIGCRCRLVMSIKGVLLLEVDEMVLLYIYETEAESEN